MRINPIYKPKGKALEYAPNAYALNIYTECNHACDYCYACMMAKRFGKPWTGNVRPREGIVEAVENQLIKLRGAGEHIHLCFSCDPYPSGVDTLATRQIIKAIKDSGNHVQILTKGGQRATRDFDLLDENDWFGITVAGYEDSSAKHEPNAASVLSRIKTLRKAKNMGIRTWVSFEPILDQGAVSDFIIGHHGSFDLLRIGKMNYRPSDIDWKAVTEDVVRLCDKYGKDYYIKKSLMEGVGDVSLLQNA